MCFYYTAKHTKHQAAVRSVRWVIGFCKRLPESVIADDFFEILLACIMTDNDISFAVYEFLTDGCPFFFRTVRLHFYLLSNCFVGNEKRSLAVGIRTHRFLFVSHSLLRLFVRLSLCLCEARARQIFKRFLHGCFLLLRIGCTCRNFRQVDSRFLLSWRDYTPKRQAFLPL